MRKVSWVTGKSFVAVSTFIEKELVQAPVELRLHWVRKEKEKRTASPMVKGITSLIVETLSEASFGLTRWGEVKQNLLTRCRELLNTHE